MLKGVEPGIRDRDFVKKYMKSSERFQKSFSNNPHCNYEKILFLLEYRSKKWITIITKENRYHSNVNQFVTNRPENKPKDFIITTAIHYIVIIIIDLTWT